MVKWGWGKSGQPLTTGSPGLLQTASTHAVTLYTSTMFIPLGILFRKYEKIG